MSEQLGFVSVPVPADRVEEVYALLGKPRAVRPAAPSPAASVSTDGEPVVDEGGGGGWPAAEVVRFYRESSPNMQAFLRALAERAPDPITSIEAGKDLPKGAQSVAGMLGAAGRRSANRHGRQLPWVAKGQSTAEGSETVFWMSVEVAAAIKSA